MRPRGCPCRQLAARNVHELRRLAIDGLEKRLEEPSDLRESLSCAEFVVEPRQGGCKIFVPIQRVRKLVFRLTACCPLKKPLSSTPLNAKYPLKPFRAS